MPKAPGNDALELIQLYCIDCHGEPDEYPEAGLSFTTDFDSLPLQETGPTLKKALDAIEGYEMPPTDGPRLLKKERQQLAKALRTWLARPTIGNRRDPGRPVIRRLTRMEYNNTVRDLLGLETDVFMVSERLLFDRDHYQPAKGEMPDRLIMAAREYGAKYPVLLRDSSLPSDSRAEHGFANRGDVQNLSAVRLAQYIQLAGEIAFHPELLNRAERMQELFPHAQFRQMASSPAHTTKPISTTKSRLAENDNVVRTARESVIDFKRFRALVEAAYHEDRGGVFGGEELKNSQVAGKGGLVQIFYGKRAQRAFAINPNEDWWFAPFATAIESSGDTLFANYNKQQRGYELTFQSIGKERFAGISTLGVVVLSRRGEQGTVALRTTADDDSTQQVSITLKQGAGVDNTFVSFQASEGHTIEKLSVDGTDFSGDYVLLDDLAFITRDAPNLQPLVQAEEPDATIVTGPTNSSLQINRELAHAPPREKLAHFMRRAFRREVTPDEVDVYISLYDDERRRGGDDEAAMRAALHGILSSPSFLYVSVGTPKKAEEKQAFTRTGTPQLLPISNEELATRLSYFLWSTMPDDELFHIAKQGQLHQDDILESQMRRMLSDPRSSELIDNFFVQWLRLRELWSAQPDKELFPHFYSEINDKRTLAQDMFGEILLLAETILVEDRPITDLLNAEYIYINGKLASLYKINPSQVNTYVHRQPLNGEDLKDDRVWFRAERFDPQRSGVLTSPAVLTLTSFPHRTSSIRRGVWILDTIFNRHPPAPQVAVADIDEQPNADHLSLREKVELHRAKAACAVCHDQIDPPGFALENFDAIGRWRNEDGGDKIDASGRLRGIGSFSSPADFREQLLSQKRRFVQGFVEHLLSYALGRKLEYYDTAVVEQIVERTAADEHRFSSLMIEIAKSEPFRLTRASDD